MDYYITFSDGGSAYLLHYGTKGMKWGVWNEETRARYGGTAGKPGTAKASKVPKITGKQAKRIAIGVGTALAISGAVAIASVNPSVAAAGQQAVSALAPSFAQGGATRLGKEVAGRFVKTPVGKAVVKAATSKAMKVAMKSPLAGVAASVTGEKAVGELLAKSRKNREATES